MAAAGSNRARMLRRSKGWIAAWLLLLVTISTGCVERRLLVRSNPPGALLYVDDKEIGMTPIATDFLFYGTRRIKLVKDGFETLVVMQPIPAPWYEYTPVDFVAENLVPGHIRDVRAVSFNMIPTVQVPNDQLVSRAESLRRTTWTQQLAGAPLPGQKPLQPPPALGLAPQQAPLGFLPPGAPLVPGAQPGVLPAPATTPAPYGTLPAPIYNLPAPQPNLGAPPSGALPGYQQIP